MDKVLSMEESKPTASKKEYIKYGLLSLAIWLLLFVFMGAIVTFVEKESCITLLFLDAMVGVSICVFIAIWAVIWFFLGYDTRKEFLKAYDKQLIPDPQFKQSFKAMYLSTHFKVLGLILALLFFWLCVTMLFTSSNLHDYIYLILLGGSSLISFVLYKKYVRNK